MQRKVVFWGRGSRAEEAIELFSEWELVAVIDSDIRYRGTKWHGVEVISFSQFLKIPDEPWILVTPDKPEEILAELQEKGIGRYMLLNDLLFPRTKGLPQLAEDEAWAVEQMHIMAEVFYRNWLRDFQLLYKAFSLVFFCGSQLAACDELMEKFRNAKHPVVNGMYSEKFLEILCGKPVEIIRYGDLPTDTDLIIFCRPRIDFLTERIAFEAYRRGITVVFSEEGFLNSIEPFMGKRHPKYQAKHAMIFDVNGLYLNANIPSRIENILNSDWSLEENQWARVRKIIGKIRKEKLSKYNCQPIRNNLLHSERSKVLVIDQVYGDKSIEFGMADDEKSFQEMLNAAITENPKADIYIKVHPVISKGHFAWVEEKDNIHLLTEAMNPIELLEQMDKVYVVSSQMGFEAAFCGCEVHCFGMPFYAGWGITKDKLICERRKKKRSIEEVFYAAYILGTTYVSYKTETVCELEDVLQELLDLRNDYFW